MATKKATGFPPPTSIPHPPSSFYSAGSPLRTPPSYKPSPGNLTTALLSTCSRKNRALNTKRSSCATICAATTTLWAAATGCREWDYSCNTFYYRPFYGGFHPRHPPGLCYTWLHREMFSISWQGQPTTYRQYDQYDILWRGCRENEQESCLSDFGIPITLGNPTGRMLFFTWPKNCS